MEKKEDYEKLYDMLLGYEQEIHKKNQKRIRIGLRCLIIIPLIFLALLFWTESSKIVFLILWIVSLFILCAGIFDLCVSLWGNWVYGYKAGGYQYFGYAVDVLIYYRICGSCVLYVLGNCG